MLDCLLFLFFFFFFSKWKIYINEGVERLNQQTITQSMKVYEHYTQYPNDKTQMKGTKNCIKRELSKKTKKVSKIKPKR